MTKIELFTTEQIRLDIFLRNELPKKINTECSNSKIRRLIIAGAVLVNGKTVLRPAFELRGSSKVFVQFDMEKFFYEKQPDDIQYEVDEADVLYEDENLIFLNKPAFFPVEQTITGNRDNLHDALVRYLWSKNKNLRNPPYAGIMHRLDRETSGVILFTKTRTGKHIMNWSEAKKIIESNPQVKEELDKNQAEYDIIKAIISTRKEKNLTQKELAELVGTKQSNIARLESGTYNPTLQFLQKIASALGKKVSVSLI